MVLGVCPCCKKEFEKTRRDKIFCSKSCAIRYNQEKYPRPPRLCEICGRPLEKGLREHICLECRELYDESFEKPIRCTSTLEFLTPDQLLNYGKYQKQKILERMK